ncbi:MAG: hypothetical protein KC561_13585, partial [Myxococcales bacterium]|nr:hypothetical protein [Myxococcales bacterium]
SFIADAVSLAGCSVDGGTGAISAGEVGTCGALTGGSSPFDLEVWSGYRFQENDRTNFGPADPTWVTLNDVVVNDGTLLTGTFRDYPAATGAIRANDFTMEGGTWTGFTAVLLEVEEATFEEPAILGDVTDLVADVQIQAGLSVDFYGTAGLDQFTGSAITGRSPRFSFGDDTSLYTGPFLASSVTVGTDLAPVGLVEVAEDYVIDVSGRGGAGGTNLVPDGGGTGGATYSANSGGAGGGSGGVGGDGDSAISPFAGAGTPVGTSRQPVVAGGGGAAGGLLSEVGVGGAGGGTIALVADSVGLRGYLNLEGLDGSSSFNAAPGLNGIVGGGGGAGGQLYVHGDAVVATSTFDFSCDGGDGGADTNGSDQYSGGGGGGGRAMFVLDNQLAAVTLADLLYALPVDVRVNPGSGGNAGTTGTLGVLATAGDIDPTNDTFMALFGWRHDYTEPNQFDVYNMTRSVVVLDHDYPTSSVGATLVDANSAVITGTGWSASDDLTIQANSLVLTTSGFFMDASLTFRTTDPSIVVQTTQLNASDVTFDGTGVTNLGFTDTNITATGVVSFEDLVGFTYLDSDPSSGASYGITGNVVASMTGNAALGASTYINADGLGFIGGAGPGAGSTASEAGGSGAGGSNGGLGGRGLSPSGFVEPGPVVGSSLVPTTFGGSGGGAGWGSSAAGGTGGGVIDWYTTGLFTLSGELSANGEAGTLDGDGTRGGG